MTPQSRIGLVTTALAFLGGVWLFVAPFIVQYQEVGEDWINATKNDLWAGSILMAVSALTLFIFAALALRDAVARAEERRRAAEEDSQDAQAAVVVKPREGTLDDPTPSPEP